MTCHSKPTSWYVDEVKRYQVDREEIENILGTHKPIPHKELMYEIIRFLESTEISSYPELKNMIPAIRNKYRILPALRNLKRLYFQAMWSNWLSCESPFPGHKIIPNANLLSAFNGHNIRGSYGVVNVTVLTEPLDSCQWQCVYCPHGPTEGPMKAPVSYFTNEPAVARAAKVGYYVVEQIRTRVRDLALTGVIQRCVESGVWKTMAKLDIRFAGGTWNSYPIEKQDEFIRQAYYAVNTIDCCDEEMRPMMSLHEEKELHIKKSMEGSGGVLIVGMSIETRPDEITLENVRRFNDYHLTWIELGIQHTDNKILRKIRRGHDVEASYRGVAIAKSWMGAKVLGHMMPDLPGTTPENDLKCFENQTKTEMFRTLISLKWIILATPLMGLRWFGMMMFGVVIMVWMFGYRQVMIPSLPHTFDHIKIYPTMRLPFTKIEKWGKDRWDPYSEKEGGQILMDVLSQIVIGLPPWVRIARLIRDFQEATKKNLGYGYTSDTIKSNMAQMVDNRLKKEVGNYQEIKNREVRNTRVDLSKSFLDLHSYRDCVQNPEMEGTEFFGSFEAPMEKSGSPRLVGLFRLRCNKNSSAIKEVNDAAILREVHVYGGYVPTGVEVGKDSHTVQHRGFGKMLVKMAEVIAYLRGYDRMVVISAPGTMGYYAKCGYHRNGRYMEKTMDWRLVMCNLWDTSGYWSMKHLFQMLV